MSNTLFLALIITVVGGVVFYKSNDREHTPEVSKSFHRPKRVKHVTRPVAPTMTETPVVAESVQIKAQETPPSATPPITSQVVAPASIPSLSDTTGQQTQPVKVIPTAVINNQPPTPYFEAKNDLVGQEKFLDLNRIAQYYRPKLEEIYKSKQLFYSEGDKIDALLSDTAEYLNNTEVFAKEANPAHMNDIKEFMDHVYKLRDQGNQLSQQKR